MDNSYKILGLNIGATLDEVEEKYNELLKEFDTSKQPDGLKEFFILECEKVKEAYKKISLSLIDNENIKQVVDEINSEKNALQSTTEKKKSKSKKSVKKKSKKVAKKVVDKSPIKKSINKPQKEKGNQFSISSETELKLKRAYLIMFILGFPLTFLILNGFDILGMIGAYHDNQPLVLLLHFLGAILVLLYHIFLILKSSSSFSISKNLADYFIERKKYFIRILIATPLMLISLYGWGGMINNSRALYDSISYYTAEQRNLSGEDYYSGCNKRKKLRLHNHSDQTLRFYISWKLKSGEWSNWLYWAIDAREYTRSGLGDENKATVYTSDYRYYINTMNERKYMYSKEIPHVTNTCNAKCINIY